jgi:transcriptional regulator with XRE-family HTH domain
MATGKAVDGKRAKTEWFRIVRLRAGMDTAQFAQAVGVSEGTVIGLEAGRRHHLADSTLITLAKAFGVDVMSFEKIIYADKAPADAKLIALAEALVVKTAEKGKATA